MLIDDLEKSLAISIGPGIDAELVCMARDAERMARSRVLRRFGRRGVTFVVVSALLLGGGTAAAATSDLWFPGAWRTGDTVELPDGTSCQIAVEVAVEPGQTPIASPVAAAARAYLGSLDLSTLLTPDPTSAADCEAQSDEIGQLVIDRVTTHLQSEGYDTSHLWMAVSAHWDPTR